MLEDKKAMVTQRSQRVLTLSVRGEGGDLPGEAEEASDTLYYTRSWLHTGNKELLVEVFLKIVMKYLRLEAHPGGEVERKEALVIRLSFSKCS